MKMCILTALLFLVSVLNDPVVLAAPGDAQAQQGSSWVVWFLLLLPTAVFLLFIFTVLRRARTSETVVGFELQRAEQERQFSREHREHLRAQIDDLDEKLSRVIDLLTAIERGQRKGDG